MSLQYNNSEEFMGNPIVLKQRIEKALEEIENAKAGLALGTTEYARSEDVAHWLDEIENVLKGGHE
jgi:hypothetical protein